MISDHLVLKQEEQAGHIDSELAVVISSIALACKQIASLVTRSGISNLTGVSGSANFSVRLVKHADVSRQAMRQSEEVVLKLCIMGRGRIRRS